MSSPPLPPSPVHPAVSVAAEPATEIALAPPLPAAHLLPAARGAPENASALATMWRALLRRNWSCLAVVAVEPGTGAGGAGALVTALRALPASTRVRIEDAAESDEQDGERVRDELVAAIATGARVVVDVGEALERPGAEVVLEAADAVLLVVRYGGSAVEAVRAVVERVGRDRVIGCVAIRGRRRARRRRG